MDRRVAGTALLLAAGAAGCATSSATSSATSAAATASAESSAPAWADWGEPGDYRFTVESSCGERTLIGVYRVTVRAGEVTAADRDDPVSGGRVALEPDELQSVPTLGDMLDEASGATGDPEAGDIEVVTDPADGHPTEVSVDHIEAAIDDESCYVVTGYEPGA